MNKLFKNILQHPAFYIIIKFFFLFNILITKLKANELNEYQAGGFVILAIITSILIAKIVRLIFKKTNIEKNIDNFFTKYIEPKHL